MSRSALRLENPRIAVEVDRQTGAIRSIRDKEQDVAYRLSGIGFEVTTDTGSIRAEKAVKVAARKDGAELRFAGNGLDITLHYRLGAGDHFIEKWLVIKSADGKPYFLKNVFLEDMTTEAFSEIHFHDDQTIWHCPINLFLRGDKGGCFAGLEYPYWELKQKGKEGFRLGYQPNYQVAKEEVNTSEKYFIGVYRKEGIHRVSQGPYPGRGRFSFVNFSGGLKQHFKGGIPNPIKEVPLETLDWGEVWAMKEFMRHVLPNDLTLPEEGYWVWQNGWWAGLWAVNPSILDYLKKAGIHDVMTAHTWYGRGVHPLSPPYIDKMRIKPMGFPKDVGIAGMPGPGHIAKGLHADQKTAQVYLNKFKPREFTPEFLLPPAMERFHKYGKKIGVHVNSFSIASVYFQERPEWAAIDKNGKVCQYLFGRKVSCFACDEYADHIFKVTDHIFKKYQPRWWGWDGRWLSFWEVGAYRPGPLGAGPDPCYAKNHGHLPGDNRYKEWKNILAFLKKVRERYPKVCLESYYGLHRGGPWALRHLDSAYHYFETHGADMNRLQSWHQQNDRFRPVYKNSLDLFGTNPRSFRFNVIAGLSIASYCMIGQAYPQFGVEENREFFEKWRAWATKNHDYLTVKRDLFDSPGHSPLDGSAHIINGRGFVFLFRGGFDKGINQKTALRGSIPINRWLKLEEDPKALYQIKEIYPREGTDLGVYQYGEEFLYDTPMEPAVILSLEPAPAGSKPRRPAMRDQPAPRVIPAFRSLAQTASADAPARLHRHYKFDEIIEKGAATPDASPNKAHARLSGQELCKGVIGKALRFKAGNKGVVLGDLGLQAPATLCFWLKRDRAQADGRILSQLEGPTTQRGCLRLIGGSLEVWNAAGWPVAVNGLSNKGVWQHVAVVYKEDGTVTGYLNGKKINTVRGGFNFRGVKAAIGAPFLGRHGRPFTGALDDFRIYSGVLKESEVKALYPPELFGKAQAAAAKAPTSQPVTPSVKLATHTAKPLPEADMERIAAAVKRIKAHVKPAESRKILVFSRAIGFVHASIPHGEQALKLMGEKTGAYTATLDDDPSVFSDPAELSRYDAVVFNNPCGNVVADPQQRKNLLEFIRKGGGFAGIHCAAHVTDWPAYVDMVGCFSVSHPWTKEVVHIRVEEPGHPLVRPFGKSSFPHMDEIYVFRSFSRKKSRVLLSLDKTRTNMKVRGSPGKDADYPLSWVHRYGKGRVFYSGLGHYPAVFWNENVLSHYLAGLQYVLGDLDAKDTPRTVRGKQ